MRKYRTKIKFHSYKTKHWRYRSYQRGPLRRWYTSRRPWRRLSKPKILYLTVTLASRLGVPGHFVTSAPPGVLPESQRLWCRALRQYPRRDPVRSPKLRSPRLRGSANIRSKTSTHRPTKRSFQEVRWSPPSIQVSLNLLRTESMTIIGLYLSSLWSCREVRGALVRGCLARQGRSRWLHLEPHRPFELKSLD